MGGGSRIRYSIKQLVLIRDSVLSEISPNSIHSGLIRYSIACIIR